MISRRWLYFIGAGFLGVLAIAHWGSNYPARVTIINASGVPLERVVLETEHERGEVGTIENGATRNVQLRPGEKVTVRYGSKRWTSEQQLTPAQSLVLFVYPEGRIEPRSRLGTINR